MEGRRKAGVGRLKCQGTWQHGLLRCGVGIPLVPVTRVLFKGVHESVKVGQFVQLRDVIPVGICEPASTWVIHLAFPIQNLGEGDRRKELTRSTSPKELP